MFLQANCSSRQHDWAVFLIWAEYAKNPMHRYTTDFVLGHQPPLSPRDATLTDALLIDDWFSRVEWVWEQAHTNIDHAVRCFTAEANCDSSATSALLFLFQFP